MEKQKPEKRARKAQAMSQEQALRAARIKDQKASYNSRTVAMRRAEGWHQVTLWVPEGRIEEARYMAALWTDIDLEAKRQAALREIEELRQRGSGGDPGP